MPQLEGLDFLLDRSAWHKTRFLETDVTTDLKPGQVLFRVDRFAFTANNITYAMVGDMLHYWRFFPTEEGWGRLPTMGFADVIASTHDDVAVGTRCSGFFPMSKHLLIEPGAVSPGSIVDGVAHRKDLSLFYNQYQPVAHDPLYLPEHEDELSLVRALFMTSFLAEDLLADSDLYGSSRVIISSASSKTSIALAFVVAQRMRAKTVGLTSARNLGFVKSLGLYDEVLTYDETDSLDADCKSVFVDMAGNRGVTRAVHERMGANLMYSMAIGGTHWDAEPDDKEIPGVQPELFFAPSQIKKRMDDWGPQGFQERLGAPLHAFIGTTAQWLRVERGYGRDAVERVFASTLKGEARPDQGHIISLWDNESDASGR
jgi:hypothetical protein